MLEGMNVIYLLSLCYNLFLSVHLNGPYFLFPDWVTWLFLLWGMAAQTGGSIEGVALAYKFGWAINLGGGFHNASARYGYNRSAYCDLRLAINCARNNHWGEWALIINTNAQFGAGLADEFRESSRVFICDIFNPQAAPVSSTRLARVNVAQAVTPAENDDAYLSKCKFKISDAISVSYPDFIIYIAGYDMVAQDWYGGMKINENTIVQRDEYVMLTCLARQTPVLMLIGDSYSSTSLIIANSIWNLLYKAQISNAPIKFPTADMYGARQGLRADMLPWTTKMINF